MLHCCVAGPTMLCRRVRWQVLSRRKLKWEMRIKMLNTKSPQFVLRSVASSSWSNLEFLNNSSIVLSGLTRVFSTRPVTFGASSRIFLRRSACALVARSNDPVSLICIEPELGFLKIEIVVKLVNDRGKMFAVKQNKSNIKLPCETG